MSERAERRERFVGGEAGSIGGDLEEHAAGFVEVDRPEVLAVLDRCHGDAGVHERAARGELRVVIGGAPGDVVHRADAHRGAPEAGGDAHVGDRARATGAALEAVDVPFAPGGAEAHDPGEEAGRRLERLLPERDAEDAADGVLRGHRAAAPRAARAAGAAQATRSSAMPSWSLIDSTWFPKRFVGPSCATPLEISRSSHQPREFCGMAREMTLTCPVPPRPRPAPGQGKKVTIVPGLPRSSPKYR